MIWEFLNFQILEKSTRNLCLLLSSPKKSADSQAYQSFQPASTTLASVGANTMLCSQPYAPFENLPHMSGGGHGTPTPEFLPFRNPMNRGAQGTSSPWGRKEHRCTEHMSSKNLQLV